MQMKVGEYKIYMVEAGRCFDLNNETKKKLVEELRIVASKRCKGKRTSILESISSFSTRKG